MITSSSRLSLEQAKGIMGSTGAAMERICKELAGASSREELHQQYDVKFIEDSYIGVAAAMQGAYEFLADNWNDIRDNEVRLYEAFLFVQDFVKFREKVDAFDDMAARNGLAPEIFGDITLPNSYFLLAARYEDLLQPVIACTGGADKRFSGLAQDMRHYVKNADDVTMEGIITGRLTPERKLRWTGPLNEATIFGDFFNIPCSRMNDCFEFRGKDGTRLLLHYSHNKANNDVKTYQIFDILIKHFKEHNSF